MLLRIRRYSWAVVPPPSRPTKHALYRTQCDALPQPPPTTLENGLIEVPLWS